MVPGRVRALIAVGAILVLIVDLALLITGVPAKKADRRNRLSDLDARRVATQSEISRLQTEYDQALVDVSGWFDVLDEVLNLGRTVEGLEQSKSRFGTAQGRHDAAQRSAANLIPLSADILDEAQAGRRDLTELISLIADAEDKAFLRSLDRAFELLITTHGVYGRLNQKIQEGYGVYEELFDISQKFFSEAFRTPRESANVYDFRTERLVPRIAQFKTDYNALREEALGGAQRTAEAFKRTTKLNEAR